MHGQVKILQAICFLTEDRFWRYVNGKLWDKIELLIIGGGQLWRGMLQAIAECIECAIFRKTIQGMPEFQVWLCDGDVREADIQHVSDCYLHFISVDIHIFIQYMY